MVSKEYSSERGLVEKNEVRLGENLSKGGERAYIRKKCVK